MKMLMVCPRCGSNTHSGCKRTRSDGGVYRRHYCQNEDCGHRFSSGAPSPRTNLLGRICPICESPAHARSLHRTKAGVCSRRFQCINQDCGVKFTETEDGTGTKKLDDFMRLKPEDLLDLLPPFPERATAIDLAADLGIPKNGNAPAIIRHLIGKLRKRNFCIGSNSCGSIWEGVWELWVYPDALWRRFVKQRMAMKDEKEVAA